MKIFSALILASAFNAAFSSMQPSRHYSFGPLPRSERSAAARKARSKYKPHQGAKEIARRAAQIERGILQTN